MRNLASLLSFAALALPYGAQAATVRTTLNIVNAELNLDGLPRPAVTADGIFPGPLITGNKNDRFQINVVNRLTDDTMHRATSIHWHGFFQAGTAEMDGPPFVNQCPINPDDEFLYDFVALEQPGTWWYHSHLSTQYCDGLRGAFVVYDPQDPFRRQYDVDNAGTVLTFADWWHDISLALFPNPILSAPDQDSVIINGAGRFLGGPDHPLAVVSVRRNLRYRFRLISISCLSNYIISIDQHRMIVIEVDGVYHQPLSVDSLRIFAAQRYSVIVHADKEVNNYWIRAKPGLGATGFENGLNSAILRYVGAPIRDPTTELNSGPLMREEELQPLFNPGAPGIHIPGQADVNLNLAFIRDDITHAFGVNKVPYIPPTVPVLLQILSGTSAPQDLLPSGSVFTLPPNKVIEISIPGFPGGGFHPFHLHGHIFDVIRVANSTVYNFNTPQRRDTVSIGRVEENDNVTIRFVTDNPGPWFFHCHIDWHLEAGLAVVFAEDVPNIPVKNNPNQAWDELCPKYDALRPDDHLPHLTLEDVT